MRLEGVKKGRIEVVNKRMKEFEHEHMNGQISERTNE